ncbi:hypothetical protein DGMP_03830 [Desulfomarina profundi]|uniref:Lipoprotein n=1 Tax=Desulfomarina profundi TaxID=2772557 RepID=A0A8D5JN30_9BACT|nr:hypothetical protein DGMP_03830 [Desulfomarina profundi]
MKTISVLIILLATLFILSACGKSGTTQQYTDMTFQQNQYSTENPDYIGK